MSSFSLDIVPLQANGPSYEVPTGRRDGVVSNISLADGMPDINDSTKKLKAKFLNKGLTEKDLVLLSGILSLCFSCNFGDQELVFGAIPLKHDLIMALSTLETFIIL